MLALAEDRAYILLSRLQIRERMRINAARMIQSRYLIKKELKKKDKKSAVTLSQLK